VTCNIVQITLYDFLSFGPHKDGKPGKSLVRRQTDGTVKPWSSTLEDSLCTLKDAFELVEPTLGFNIEVKFHDTDETPEHELKRVISAILAVLSRSTCFYAVTEYRPCLSCTNTQISETEKF
jgi:glycerophosphodiester phosphodiesterase